MRYLTLLILLAAGCCEHGKLCASYCQVSCEKAQQCNGLSFVQLNKCVNECKHKMYCHKKDCGYNEKTLQDRCDSVVEHVKYMSCDDYKKYVDATDERCW